MTGLIPSHSLSPGSLMLVSEILFWPAYPEMLACPCLHWGSPWSTLPCSSHCYTWQSWNFHTADLCRSLSIQYYTSLLALLCWHTLKGDITTMRMYTHWNTLAHTVSLPHLTFLPLISTLLLLMRLFKRRLLNVEYSWSPPPLPPYNNLHCSGVGIDLKKHGG